MAEPTREIRNKLDVREYPDGRRAVCNLIAFSQFSIPSWNASDSKSLSLNPINYENAFAIDLAIRHLNQRNGSIIKEIENMDGTCDIEFVGEFFDTEDDAVTAAKRLASRIVPQDTATENRYSPCAVIGATSSFSENIQTSIIANTFGYSVVSGINQGTILSHNDNFPRFARTIPSTFGPASAFVKYVYEELPFSAEELPRYLVILRADTDHSNDYVSSIRRAISYYDPGTFVVSEIFVQQDGSNVKQAIESLEKLRISTVMAIFEGVEYSSQLYDVVMEEARHQGVAGDGHHVWFFPESVLEYSRYLMGKLRDPEGFQGSSLLLEAYQGGGIIKSGRLESKYFDLVKGIKMQSESPGHMEYMQSILPNAFEDTNSNATREMMSETGFLNEDSLDSRIQFLYEATVLLGLSACSATDGDLFLSGNALHETLVQYNFTGISGDVMLDGISGSRMQNSTDYSIVNIRAIEGNRLELRHTATITNKTLVRVEGESFVYNDGRTTLPMAVWEAKVETTVGNIVLVVFTSILCFVAVAAAVLSAIWTYQNRKTRIIRASQDVFLYLISIGSALIALTMAPVIAYASVEMNQEQGKIVATLSFWFFFIGISLLLSSFYSKLSRINKIMNSSKHFRRVTVRVRDAILPVIIAVSLNVLFLSLLTALDPVELWLKPYRSDSFDRTTHVYQSKGLVSEKKFFGIPLIVINFGIFFLAVYEAWKARNLSTEFQENESILKSLVVILICTCICLPVRVLSNDLRISMYVLTTFFCASTLSIQVFLFGEKYLHQRKLTAKQKLDDEASGSVEEKLYSKIGRQQLALENQQLQSQVLHSQLKVSELRSRITKSRRAILEETGKTDQDATTGDDSSSEIALDLSESMRLSTDSIKERLSTDSIKERLSTDSIKEIQNVRLYSQWAPGMSK